MQFITTLWRVVSRAGAWAARNPERAMHAVQQMGNFCSGKKYEPSNHADRILVAEQRVNQLQEKLEKQEKKLDALYRQTQAMDKQIRKLRIWLTVTGIALAVAMVAIALFVFVL